MVGAVVGKVHHPGEQREQREPGQHAEDGRHQRDRGGHERPEHDQQQHQCAGQPDDFGFGVAGLLAYLPRARAVRDLQACLRGGGHRVIQLVQVGGLQRVRVHVPRDAGVGDRAVLGHGAGIGRGERADRLDDVRQLGDVADRLVDRRLLIRDRALGGVEDDLPAVPALLRERAVQHVQAARGVAAGDRVVVDVLAAERILGGEQPAENDHPGDDEDPVPSGRDTGDSFQQGIHSSVPLPSPAETRSSRTLSISSVPEKPSEVTAPSRVICPQSRPSVSRSSCMTRRIATCSLSACPGTLKPGWHRRCRPSLGTLLRNSLVLGTRTAALARPAHLRSRLPVTVATTCSVPGKACRTPSAKSSGETEVMAPILLITVPGGVGWAATAAGVTTPERGR